MNRFGLTQSIANYIFLGELAPFRGENGLYGYINKSGEVVIDPKFLAAGPFNEGIAPVALSVDDQNVSVELGYIDSNGYVGVRQGDIYASTPHYGNYSDALLPVFNNSFAIAHSFFKNKELPIGLNGFMNNNLISWPYLTDFNSDGIATCSYFDPSGQEQHMVVTNEGKLINIIINEKPSYPRLTKSDRARWYAWPRANKNSIGYFTNSKSDGIYHFPVQEGNACFLLTLNDNKTGFDILHGPVESISHFKNNRAVQFFDGELILVDKSLQKIKTIQQVDRDLIVNVLASPDNNFVSVSFFGGGGHEHHEMNFFDLKKEKWLYNSNLQMNDRETEIVDNFLIYRPGGDGSMGGIFLKNIYDNSPQGLSIKNATDPSKGIICIENHYGKYAYINKDYEEIFSFTP
jgi:hypothetical protein